MAAAVQLRQVRKSYDGKNSVIHGIDLDIREGEFTVFVGPSGCGKSTLLRMIAGLESISGGEVLIDGKVVNQMPPRSRDISMVFQDYALYPHKTLYDNMAFGLRLQKVGEDEIKARVIEAARLLRIDHMLERRPGALSGGQRQRVAIGRAIVRKPKVFLFDEPLSNLDAQLRNEMRTEIKRLHKRLGATMIYVTHDQVEAMTLADRIAVLSGGHKMQYDTPDTIYNRPAALFVAGFTGSPAMNLLDVQIQNNQITFGPELNFSTNTVGTHQRAFASGAYKLGIRPENLRLTPQPGDVVLPAAVNLIEPLGAETLVTLRIGQVDMVARLPAQFKAEAGSLVTLHSKPSEWHLFDPKSGRAV